MYVCLCVCALAREYVCRTVFENFAQRSTPTRIYRECLTCVLAAYSSRNSSRRREILDKKESISNMEFVVLWLCFFLGFFFSRPRQFIYFPPTIIIFFFFLPDKELISKYLYIHPYIPSYLWLGVLFLGFFCSFRLRIFVFNYISFIKAWIHLPLHFVQMIIILTDDLLHFPMCNS